MPGSSQPEHLERPPHSTDRACRWALALSCLFLFAQVSPYWYATRDGASYLSIARSLALGDGPRNLGERQLFFAPGYSFFVAPLLWLQERPFVGLALLNAALGVAFLFATRAWLQLHCGADALLLAATCVVNASVGILLRRTLSEALFMPALMFTIVWLERLRAAATTRTPIWSALAAGCALALVCLTRQAGVMALPGFAIALGMSAYRKQFPRRRALLVLTMVSVPTVVAVMSLAAYERSTSAGASRTYIDFFANDAQPVAEQLSAGLRLRVSEVGRVALPGMFKAAPDGRRTAYLNLTIYSLTAAVIAYGWWRALMRSHDTLLWSVPFYLALYIVWPFDEGIRFMAPLAPVWCLGLYWSVPEIPVWRRRVAWLGWVTHLLVAVGYWWFNDLPDARRDAAQWPAIDQLAAAIDVSAGPVAWLPVKRDRERVMLQLALDRRVIDFAPTQRADDRAAWIVAPGNAPPPPDFDKMDAVGEYALWRRSARFAPAP